MRLIDADELEKVMTEDWFLEILATQDSKSAIKKDIVNCIDSVPLAYDVEAKVAELEKLKEKPSGCNGIWCNECKYTSDCYEGEQGYKVALDRAISIVRGKE